MRGKSFLRFLDRYVGIPLIFLLGLRRKRKLPKSIARICLVKTAGIGDLVLMTGVIRDLQSRFPDAKITLVVTSSTEEMAKLIPGVEVVRLPRGRFDLLLDFGQWPRFDACISWLARAKFKVGFRTKGQHRHYIYDQSVEHRADVHELENFRNLAKAIGVKSTSMPLIAAEEVDREKVAVLHRYGAGRLAHLRKWPEAKWEELANYLEGEGYVVHFTDRCQFTLEEVVKLLKRASLCVSINTGIMHMAAALDTPLVALHGPTDVKRWGPKGKNALSIYSASDYSPCLNLGFESKCKNCMCMKSISFAQVKKAINRVKNFASNTCRKG